MGAPGRVWRGGDRRASGTGAARRARPGAARRARQAPAVQAPATVSRTASVPATCEQDRGESITPGTSATGTLACHGDTALLQGEVLAAGTSMTAGTFTLATTDAGVGCAGSTDGHGFTLPTTGYELS